MTTTTRVAESRKAQKSAGRAVAVWESSVLEKPTLAPSLSPATPPSSSRESNVPRKPTLALPKKSAGFQAERKAGWRRPVAADSLAVFRIGFGLLVAFSSLRFLAKGWVDTLYLAPENHLTYGWFGWVAPLPAPWMHLHMVALAVLGICIALGYRHRLATALFIVGFAYTELIEASLYLNHYWFITLAAVLLLLLPAHHHWSLDAAACRTARAHHSLARSAWRAAHPRSPNGASRTDTLRDGEASQTAHHRPLRSAAGRTARQAESPAVQAWVVWALRAQVGIVYVFAGLAKLNGDWLFHAQPLRLWLADRTHLPFIGSFLDEPLVAYAASWGSAAFDCTIVAWLLWRRSRPWAYAVLVVFHIATWLLFPKIGVFPWVMIFCALVFFRPDWPRQLAKRVRVGLNGTAAEEPEPMLSAPVQSDIANGKIFGEPAQKQIVGASDDTENTAGGKTSSASRTAMGSPCIQRRAMYPNGKTSNVSRPAIVLLAIFAAVQVFLPLRHYLEPGNVRWNEQGYYLAWRVMLTEKAGHLEYKVTDPATGRTLLAYPELVLTDWQAAHAATRPDLIHATALLIADHYEQQGISDAEVRATSWVSMNGRQAKQFIDPAINLAAHPRGEIPTGWILSENA